MRSGTNNQPRRGDAAIAAENDLVWELCRFSGPEDHGAVPTGLAWVAEAVAFADGCEPRCPACDRPLLTAAEVRAADGAVAYWSTTCRCRARVVILAGSVE